jgi:hypothetical protein
MGGPDQVCEASFVGSKLAQMHVTGVQPQPASRRGAAGCRTDSTVSCSYATLNIGLRKVGFAFPSLNTRRCRVAKMYKPCQQYTYGPLPGDDCFRQLILAAGDGDEPLRCRLTTLRFADVDEQPYEALSYVWGSDVRAHDIYVEEPIGPDSILHITANLHAALRALRQPNTWRVLWADSICVNQGDIAERSQQVSFMGQIYSKARRVEIYLGSDGDGLAQQAASLIADVDKMISEKIAEGDGSPDSFPRTKGDDPLLADPRWKAFTALISQPEWFSRGWVVQEAGLAAHAEVLWGHQTECCVSWSRLMRICTWLDTRGDHGNRIVQRLSFVDLHQKLYLDRYRQELTVFFDSALSWRRTRMTFVTLLRKARQLGLKDDRDRIFAFLALADHLGDDFDESDFRPRYDKPVLDVYLDFAIKYFESSQNFDLLHEVENDEENLRSTYPSWVPRWHLKFFGAPMNSPASPFLRSDDTSRARSIRMEILPNNALRMWGNTLGRVCFLSKEFSEQRIEGCDLARLWGIIAGFRPSPYADSTRHQAFLDTLVCTRFKTYPSAWSYLFAKILNSNSDSHDPLNGTPANADDAYVEMARGGLPAEPSQQEKCELDFDFYRHLEGALPNRRFFVTERGYFGLAPGSAREDDFCCNLWGTRSQFILRKTETEGQYKILGQGSMLSKTWIAPEHEERWYGYHIMGWNDQHRDWKEWGIEDTLFTIM